MSAHLCRRTFARAAEILGGSDKLAAYLRTDLAQVQRWARSSKPPPVAVLRSLAQLLAHEITSTAHRPRKDRSRSSRK
jgi:hypothetical protein